MQLGGALSASGQAVQELKYRLSWANDEVETNSTMISSAAIFGVTIGAAIGGQIISRGRRKSVLFSNCLGIFGSLLSIVGNLYVITVGRFLFGISAGINVVACPKILEETLPSHLMDYGFGTSTATGINFMTMITLLFGLFNPKSNEGGALATSESWRVLFLIPVVCMSIAIFLNLLVFRYDSVEYHCENG
jgi:MFS family permease